MLGVQPTSLPGKRENEARRDTSSKFYYTVSCFWGEAGVVVILKKRGQKNKRRTTC